MYFLLLCHSKCDHFQKHQSGQAPIFGELNFDHSANQIRVKPLSFRVGSSFSLLIIENLLWASTRPSYLEGHQLVYDLRGTRSFTWEMTALRATKYEACSFSWFAKLSIFFAGIGRDDFWISFRPTKRRVQSCPFCSCYKGSSDQIKNLCREVLFFSSFASFISAIFFYSPISTKVVIITTFRDSAIRIASSFNQASFSVFFCWLISNFWFDLLPKLTAKAYFDLKFSDSPEMI